MAHAVTVPASSAVLRIPINRGAECDGIGDHSQVPLKERTPGDTHTAAAAMLLCCWRQKGTSAAALDIVKIVYRLAADFPVCLAGKIRSLFTVSRSPECGYSGFHSFQCCCVFYCVVMVVAVSLAPTAVDL